MPPARATIRLPKRQKNHRGKPRRVGVELEFSGLDVDATVEAVRASCQAIEHCVALEGAHDGWLDYEQLVAAETGARPEAEPASEIDERDLLTINYTSGTT